MAVSIRRIHPLVRQHQVSNDELIQPNVSTFSEVVDGVIINLEHRVSETEPPFNGAGLVVIRHLLVRPDFSPLAGFRVALSENVSAMTD